MNENKIIEIAKEAYVLYQQVEQFERALYKTSEAVVSSGYLAHINNFNAILKRTKDIFTIDEILLKSVEHISEAILRSNAIPIDIVEEIKVNLSVLKGALIAFVQFHLPKEEKEKIGFQ